MMQTTAASCELDDANSIAVAARDKMFLKETEARPT
jgi:hypothetical protein